MFNKSEQQVETRGDSYRGVVSGKLTEWKRTTTNKTGESRGAGVATVGIQYAKRLVKKERKKVAKINSTPFFVY